MNDQDDRASGFGELWERQSMQEQDFGMYNSIPWMLLKTVLGISILVLIYLLYALQELPWSIFGSAVGLLILGFGPFFVGVVLGFSFESMKKALAFGMTISFAAMGIAFFLFRLPYSMDMALYHPGFMLNVWFYSVIWFIVIMSFVPAGIAVAAASNQYE